MLQGIDHDFIRLQHLHATCNTQRFQHTRCNSVACSKLHVVREGRARNIEGKGRGRRRRERGSKKSEEYRGEG